MRTARICGESGIYHVVSRGVGQQIIFETDADRRRYLGSLQSLVDGSSGALLAWCLMDNHAHLLISQPLDELSATMRRLNSSYALYFNLVHDRIVMGVLGGLDAFLGFHGQADFAAGCIDVSPRRKRVDDAAALAVALELFGDAGLGEVKSLPRGERDEALVRMKERGLTVRQIQRLTGVSLGTISHARTNLRPLFIRSDQSGVILRLVEDVRDDDGAIVNFIERDIVLDKKGPISLGGKLWHAR